MTPAPAGGPHRTHAVLNQVPPLAGHDVADDPALLAGLAREGAGWAETGLHELGTAAGAADTAEHARLANEHPPVLRSHDAQGNRIDEVEFHPSWHVLLGTAVRAGLHAAPVVRAGARRAGGPGGQVLRVVAGRGRARLPGVDDLRRGTRAAPRAGPGPPVRAAAGGPGVRPGAAAPGGQGRAAGRDGDDREAGRVGRARRDDPGRAGPRRRGRRPPGHRAQVVLLRADE